MNKLSKRLNREEFECPCGCGFNTVDIELVVTLESLANWFEIKESNNTSKKVRVVIHINSGARCIPYELSKNRKGTSQHVFGKAADFWLEFEYDRDRSTRVKIPDVLIANRLEKMIGNKNGLGRYKGRTHYDSRSGKAARWDER